MKCKLAIAVLALSSASAWADVQDQTWRSDHALHMKGDRITTALNVLESKGYSDFRDFREQDAGFSAAVRRGDRKFMVHKHSFGPAK